MLELELVIRKDRLKMKWVTGSLTYCISLKFFTFVVKHTHTDTHSHNHFTALWILSKTTQVSQY